MVAQCSHEMLTSPSSQTKKSKSGWDRHDFNRDGQIDLMITTINIESLKGSLWKRIKGFMGDDIRLGLEFYQMEKGAYASTPNTTRGIALDGVPSHREPGWVPLDVVLRGATHENRNREKKLSARLQHNFAYRRCNWRRSFRSDHRRSPRNYGRFCRCART